MVTAVRPTLKKGDVGQRVKDLQAALTAAGYDVGAPDGDFGALTLVAVSAFQRASSLVADGVVGALTAAALNKAAHATPAVTDSVAVGRVILPQWCWGLERIIGTHEIKGLVDNDVIMSYSRKVAVRYPSLRWATKIFTHDEVPHCGAGIAYSVAEDGIMPDSRYPSALSWADWGQPLDGPALGAVGVKTRHSGGHVLFCAGKTAAGRIAGLGSNQSDSVSVAPFNPADFTAWRWPPGRPLPPAGQIGLRNLPVVKTGTAYGGSEA